MLLLFFSLALVYVLYLPVVALKTGSQKLSDADQEPQSQFQKQKWVAQHGHNAKKKTFAEVQSGGESRYSKQLAHRSGVFGFTHKIDH